MGCKHSTFVDEASASGKEKPSVASDTSGSTESDSNNARRGLSMTRNYNDYSAAQAGAAEKRLTPLLYLAAKEIHKNRLTSSDPETPVVVCEYGCATGGSSIAPLNAITKVIGNRPLRVVMNDLPCNDWDVLRETLEPNYPPTVKFEYKPMSMYGSVVEEDCVHLAYSCYAQHWLSEGTPTKTLPVETGALWANQLSEGEELDAWERASRDDWRVFLSERSKEMRDGGLMVLVIQCSCPNGTMNEKFAETLRQAKLTMIEKKMIDTDTAAHMVIPEFAKTPTDILQLLSSDENKAAWKLEEMHYAPEPCHYKKMHEEGVLTNEETIDTQIKCLRAFMDVSLNASLTNATLSSYYKEEDTSVIAGLTTAWVDLFWQHVKSMVNGDPSLLTLDILDTTIVLRRLPRRHKNQ